MTTSAELIGAWASAAAPPPMLTVSEWADARRVLPESSGASGGRWYTDTVPYLRGIMDALHEPGIRQIALMKGHQIGGSEAIANMIGYHIEHSPCPMLFVLPTASDADEWSKSRLADMIRSTPTLAAVVNDKRKPRGSFEAESTVGLKIFPGGFLALGGANTPNTFARRSVRNAFGDDVDRWPPIVGDEGDPADLLANRTTSFYDGLVVMVSTPTLKHGRIDTLYQHSDQRRYVVPCLACGRRDWITWNDPNHFRILFEEKDPETARLACRDAEHGGCGERVAEPERRAMVAKGEWQATATPLERGHAGFHLPSFLSTIGDVTLPRLVEKWLSARAKGKESLRVFVNTSLAEGWEDRGARMEANALVSRRDDYGQDANQQPFEVPAAAVCLTAGVDVQDNRFELLVQGWGPADERWVVDWRRIPGDPKQQETRAALLEALSRRYSHALGVHLPILATCLDTGYATEEMYDFVLAYQVRRIFATKGFAGKTGEPIVGKPSEKRYGKNPRPVPLYPLNVDDGKADILSSLRLNLEAPLGTGGPGMMHFPLRLDSVDDEFFAQLCSEHRETRYNKGGVATHTVWVQDREANHALDCFDAESEVLTKTGWKPFAQLAESDQIATVNLNSDAIEYERPVALIAKRHVGEMLSIAGRRIDLLVTPTHRMVSYLKRHEKGMWRFDVPPQITLARDLTKHHALKCAATWAGIAPAEIRIGQTGPGLCHCGCGQLTPLAPRTDRALGWVKGQPRPSIGPAHHRADVGALAPGDFAEFIGWYVAEGSATIRAGGKTPYYRVTISQRPGKKRDRLEVLLDRLPWHWRGEKHDCVISSKALAEYLKREAGIGADGKRVPQWIKDATPEIIGRFVDAAILGDGWVQTKPGQQLHRTYATVSRELADDMQELFIKLGRTANIKRVAGKPWRIRGRSGDRVRDQFHVSECKASRIYLVGGGGGRREFIGRYVDYDGMVYCATVPNGTLIVRRRGKAFIAGNCSVMALAAKRLLNPNIRQMAEMLAEAAAQQAAARERPTDQRPPTLSPQGPAPRTARSKYLGG